MIIFLVKFSWVVVIATMSATVFYISRKISDENIVDSEKDDSSLS